MNFDLYEIARLTGGHVSAKGVVYAPAPGRKKHDRSMMISIDPERAGGLYVYLHSPGCPFAAKDDVLSLMGLPPVELGQRPSKGTVTRTPRPVRTELSDEDRERIGRALAIWDEAKPPEGTPVERYLARRGLALPAAGAGVLRYHPRCPFGPRTRTPAMLALVTDIRAGFPRGVHRTALHPDGTKAEVGGYSRLAMGSIGGGAVMLTPAEDVVSCLGVAEGIETALSLQHVPEFGPSPVWSLISANGIASLPRVPGVETLWVAVDHDEAGDLAAKACVDRWRAVETVLVRARRPKADLNDLVKESIDAA